MKKRKILFGIIFLLLCLGTITAIVLVPIFSVKAEKEVLIKIPQWASKENVNDTLTKYLGERYADLVMRTAFFRGSDFSGRYGAYLIEEGTTPVKAEQKLSRGSQHPLKIVINGFRTPSRLAEKLSVKLDFSPEEFLTAIEDTTILKQYGLKPGQGMALFPEATYEVYWNDSPETVISRTGDFYKKIWNEQRIRKAGELGLSPAEVMILCSIVDEETIKPEDKGPIGRLYINRLNRGMKLQADPTVKYAVGDFSLRRIRSEHLKKESPYNTYIHPGLPPGPIRTTGLATIDSVLNSRPSEYIYMCAKEDFSGYHSFAKTYEEHLKNARRYQQALNRKNIY